MTTSRTPNTGTDPLFDVRDKLVLITGGSRGLGLRMAHGFAGRGAHVLIASRKVAACEEVAAELRDTYGTKAGAYACNVSDWSQCDELMAAVHAEFGQLDVLVNNAGLSPLYPSLEKVEQALFDKVIGVNLRGPFRLSVLAGARMAEGRGGSIINVTSTQSIKPRPHALPYAAAKAGLNAVTEGLAHAFGPTVRVNAILCGPFLTEVAEAWDMEAFEQRAGQTMALRRGGRPEEIVGAALYYASGASSFATGAVLRLDGGYV